MSEVTAEQYLEMWLSEQIPPSDWLLILEEGKDVSDLFTEHLNRRNNE